MGYVSSATPEAGNTQKKVSEENRDRQNYVKRTEPPQKEETISLGESITLL